MNGSVRDASVFFQLHDGHSSIILNQLSHFFNQRNSRNFLTALRMSSNCSLSTRAFHQNLAYILLFSIRTTYPTHLILHLIKRIKCGVEYSSLRPPPHYAVLFIVLLIIESSPLPCYCILLRPKYLPQYPILEYSQPMFLTQYEKPSSTPIQSKKQNNSSVHLNFYIVVVSKLEDKRCCTEW